MTTKRIELVGILVLHNKLDHTYSINSVSRRYDGEGNVSILTQLGIDWKMHLTFKVIIQALCDAYAGGVINVWLQDNKAVSKAYLQMHLSGRPKNINLSGEWLWWAEW